MKNFLIIFFLCLVIFNLNFTSIGATDTIPSSILPFNIFEGNGIFLDKFYNQLKSVNQDLAFLWNYNGHVISGYPLIGGFLSIPIYFPFYLLMKATGHVSIIDFTNASYILEKLSASIITALSVGFFYLLALSLSKSKKESFMFALIFAFATQTFSTSAQALWQHGPANLFLILSEIYLLKVLRSETIKKGDAAIVLVTALAAFASRNVFLIYVVVSFAAILIKNSTKNPFELKSYNLKHWIRSARSNLFYIILVTFGLTLIFLNNYIFYGSILGYYRSWINNGGLGLKYLPSVFAGLFFSPARGILFYTPIYFFSFSAFIFINKMRKSWISSLFVINAIYLLAGIGFYSIWGIWWGGQVWGNRFFTDFAVPVVLLVLYSYKSIKNNLAKFTFYFLAGISVLSQIIGVFAYPYSAWDDFPVRVMENQSPLWNFHDTPITRSLVVGTDFTSLKRLLYWINLNFGKNNAIKTYSGFDQACGLRFLGDDQELGYRIVRVAFTNKSNIDWLTVGHEASTMNLSQVFYGGGRVVVSPIAPVNFPVVIKKGETVNARLVIIPPLTQYKRLAIIPSQNGELWVSSCKLALN